MTHANTRITLVAAFGLGTALGFGCRTQNSKHCYFNEGNATCAERYDGERPYCVTNCYDTPGNDGCVEARPEPLDDACYSPCGDEKSLEDDPNCEGVADTGSSSADDGPTGDPSSAETTMTTVDSTSDDATQGSVSITGSETDDTATTSSGCMDSSECGVPASPICVDLMCAPCTEAGDGDAECVAKDPGTPACRDDGQCVQCTSANANACADTTPICDADAGACVGCTYHEQCDAPACDIATGACFEDCTVTVDGDGGAMFDNITDAVVEAAMSGCVVIVHEQNAEAPYTEAVVIDGETVAIFAASGEGPLWQGTGGNPTLTTTGNANVYLQAMRLVGNTGTGLVVTAGAYTDVRSCFVAGNGNQFQDHHGISVDGATLHVSYSSIVANDGDGADSLTCTGAGGTVRDSILLGADSSSIDCAGVTLEANAVDENFAGNDDVSPLDGGWFVNIPTDVHLTGMGATAFGGIAEWNTGDPTLDIDGAPRPAIDGTADVAGADLP